MTVLAAMPRGTRTVRHGGIHGYSAQGGTTGMDRWTAHQQGIADAAAHAAFVTHTPREGELDTIREDGANVPASPNVPNELRGPYETDYVECLEYIDNAGEDYAGIGSDDGTKYTLCVHNADDFSDAIAQA